MHNGDREEVAIVIYLFSGSDDSVIIVAVHGWSPLIASAANSIENIKKGGEAWSRLAFVTGRVDRSCSFVVVLQNDIGTTVPINFFLRQQSCVNFIYIRCL